MAKQIINNTEINPDTLKVAFDKVNNNFDEVYLNFGALNPVAIQALPIYDTPLEANVLPDYTPYRTSSGQLRYKTPTGTSPLLWDDSSIWNDLEIWND